MFQFGARLKEIRQHKHLTQRQLANIIGVTERGVQRYESGERKPTFDVLIAILDNIDDISADYLLGRTDNPNSHKS